MKTRRREFPDRCFLTRRQQLCRGNNDESPWNDVSKTTLLRNRSADVVDDKLEFNFGYEKPERTQDYTSSANPDYNHWDQIDVRMFYFDKVMRLPANAGWMKEAEGMWYIQDYMDFMQMLQTLDVPENLLRGEENFWNFTDDPLYKLPNCAPIADPSKGMPIPLPVNDSACHRFGILAWFFDCRDAGACGYRWEDFVLTYFGAYITTDGETSKFEEFAFKHPAQNTLYQYFNQPWFEICVFLEHNFRNAIAPMVEGQPWVPVGSTVGPRFLAGNRGSPQKIRLRWVPVALW
jgi:hypothetical protein